MTIYLGNITYDTTEAELYDLVSQFGQIFDLNYPVDGITGKKRGFAFVTITEPGKAEDAIKNLDGMEFKGRPLRVSIGKPQNLQPSRGIPVGFRKMGENPFFGGGRRR